MTILEAIHAAGPAGQTASEVHKALLADRDADAMPLVLDDVREIIRLHWREGRVTTIAKRDGEIAYVATGGSDGD